MDSMEPTQPDVATTKPIMRPPRPPQVISSSNPNKRKSSSTAWDHFEKFIDEEGRTKARCIYCSKEYMADSKIYGTSNLKNHTPICPEYLYNELHDGQDPLSKDVEEGNLVPRTFTNVVECKRATEVVLDHSAGDTVCSECGLVLEAHSIDETSEWRTFANETGDNDPVRVGGASNPLLSDGGLSTVISSRPNNANGGSDFLGSGLGRWQSRGSNPDRLLLQAFKAIASMADRLGLVATIKDRANEIYKKVEDQKPLRGRNQDAILAACLYIACRQEDKPRTVKEICSVANGATKKEIGRAKEFIVKQLEVEMGQSMEMGTIHAEDFLRRFCSHLGMTNQAVKAAQEAVQKSEELDIRRSPISVAAAVIYMITQLSDDKKLLKDISLSTGVAEGTIRNSYKDLYPYAVRLIPSWYAKEEDLRNLCSP
ncbi:hypothetical protein SO802_019613 [Lithocarpus litseifolius]|uniref:BED-type domain-containing protein n=1 Tax=Lithocarpus litseifolius TaxID=425828 RepID=A0AAW2CP86_9ROSI